MGIGRSAPAAPAAPLHAAAAGGQEAHGEALEPADQQTAEATEAATAAATEAATAPGTGVSAPAAALGGESSEVARAPAPPGAVLVAAAEAQGPHATAPPPTFERRSNRGDLISLLHVVRNSSIDAGSIRHGR